MKILSVVKKIILHCSATAEGKDFRAKHIREWHVKGNGWSDIGYHFVIDLDGTVEAGRKVIYQGAHTTGENSRSLGVCYVGGLGPEGKFPKDTRTAAQKEAMYGLVDELLKKYRLEVKDVYCHNQFARKACPSFKVEEFRREFEEWRKKRG